jgi:GT2 family glycosyltransferase
MPKNGWYMIEVLVSTELPINHCTITLYAETGKHRYPVRLYPGQASKRILRLRNVREIEIIFNKGLVEDCNLQSVKLTKLTYIYAKKLVSKKLRCTHPVYQDRTYRQPDSRKKFSLQWRDYCNLFSCPDHLVRYADWIWSFDTGSTIRFESSYIASDKNYNIGTILMDNWIVFLDKDCILSKNFLKYFEAYASQLDEFNLIYADSDQISVTGFRCAPQFNPDWDRDLFYSKNYIAGLVILNKRIVDQMVLQGVAIESINAYERILRSIEILTDNEIFHIPKIMFHRLTQTASTDVQGEDESRALSSLNEHLQRSNIPAIATWQGHGMRLKYAIPSPEPLVSIIIPTKNQCGLLKKCIDALINKTLYKNYEILVVDNGSDEQDALCYLAEIARNSTIKVLHDPRPFNYSALNNFAVQQCKGEVLAFLNNDIEVISAEWLSEMLGHALRLEVGAVGAKLYYPNDTVQHAGVILGLAGFVEHVYRGLARNDVGYQKRAMLTQSYCAVTGACLMVRKSKYLEVGGFNEADLPVAFNDIDLCLKLRTAGYRTIWSPYAELYHHESISRGADNTPEKRLRAAKEVAYMQKTWGNLMLQDPAYNPNLNLLNENFDLAWPPRTLL